MYLQTRGDHVGGQGGAGQGGTEVAGISAVGPAEVMGEDAAHGVLMLTAAFSYCHMGLFAGDATLFRHSLAAAAGGAGPNWFKASRM